MSSETINESVPLNDMGQVSNAPDTKEMVNVEHPKKLSVLDRFLSVWILLCMISGTLVGIYAPGFRAILDTSKIGQVSIPVFVGLVFMLYPVFCKVRYEELGAVFSHENYRFHLLFSFVLNWIVCPMIMAALAWACLPDLADYRVGVLLVGVARCIAMVLIWNDLASGDPEWCVILVTVNSVLQMLLFAPFAYFYTVIIGQSAVGSIQMWPVVQNVLLFLGIPLFSGLLTRLILQRLVGSSWYDQKLLKYIGPLALIGLLYTIFIIFALQGNQLVSQLGPVCRVLVPLVLYFCIVWFMTMFLSRLFRFEFPMAVTQSFTAASNNFELALAIAIATYGIESHQALATTIGPLVEVPVLLALVYVTPLIQKIY